MACGEFSLIAHYFDHVRSSHLDVKLGISNNCTLLNIPKKQTLAISTDTLVAGNHFLPDINPADLAYKALAVNLSNLAAMGANPAWLTLALTLPDIDKAWLESFSNSLFDLLNYYNMQLIGSNTTRGPLSMTLGIHSFVPMGQALTHSGAKPGDWIYVTSTPGNSTTRLAILQNHLQVANAKDADYLIKHHLHPSPRILQGQALHNLANSAINLSDSLISNLRHIMKASNCSAHIDLALLPFSDALSHHVEPEQALHWALSGSEDYKLCFTVPELNHGTLDVALRHLGIPFTCIRQMTTNIKGLCFIHDSKPVTLDWKGYDHFATP